MAGNVLHQIASCLSDWIGMVVHKIIRRINMIKGNIFMSVMLLLLLLLWSNHNQFRSVLQRSEIIVACPRCAFRPNYGEETEEKWKLLIRITIAVKSEVAVIIMMIIALFYRRRGETCVSLYVIVFSPSLCVFILFLESSKKICLHFQLSSKPLHRCFIIIRSTLTKAHNIILI